MAHDDHLRVLFVGPLWEGTDLGTSTSMSRLRALHNLGLNITSLDTTCYLPSGPRLLRSFAIRTFAHPSVYRMNMQLRDLVQKKQHDVIWIEKGDWLYPWTLAYVRKQGCFLVHYNTDDIFGRYEHLWLHRLGIKYYDLYLTTNRYNVTEIRRSYGINTMRVGMGYDSNVHRPFKDFNGGKKIDIVFVGTWRPQTEEYLVALWNAGIDLQVWGNGWRKAHHEELRTVKPLPHADYARKITSAKIALCSVSRWNRNESTGRSFEIPAIGTFMLAEHTPEHEFIYGDGVGVGLFRTTAELVEKARYYLENPSERKAIAREGHARSLEPGYSWAGHMRREWPIVERLLKDPTSTASPVEDEPFWPGFRRGTLPQQAGI